MSLDMFSVMIGAVAAILGGIIGGWVQGFTWFHYEKKRARVERKARLLESALSWSHRGRQENFRGADLRGVNLRGVDLGPAPGSDQGIDLSYSDLRGALMLNTVLDRANLTGADLRGAILTRASLKKANLEYANLRRAQLAGADLQEARLVSADLREASLGSISTMKSRVVMGASWRWRYTQHSFAFEKGATLVEANLAAADLRGADLRGADLRDAHLHSKDLRKAKYDSDTIWPDWFTPPSEAKKYLTMEELNEHLRSRTQARKVKPKEHTEDSQRE